MSTPQLSPTLAITARRSRALRHRWRGQVHAGRRCIHRTVLCRTEGKAMLLATWWAEGRAFWSPEQMP